MCLIIAHTRIINYKSYKLIIQNCPIYVYFITLQLHEISGQNWNLLMNSSLVEDKCIPQWEKNQMWCVHIYRCSNLLLHVHVHVYVIGRRGQCPQIKFRGAASPLPPSPCSYSLWEGTNYVNKNTDESTSAHAMAKLWAVSYLFAVIQICQISHGTPARDFWRSILHVCSFGEDYCNSLASAISNTNHV